MTAERRVLFRPLTPPLKTATVPITRQLSPLKIVVNFASTTRYIAHNSTPDGRHENQRVEVVFLTKGTLSMRLLVALILPWLTFFTIGRPFAGIVCLVLQITVIGWLPATIWAVYSLSQYKTDKKIEKALGQRGA